MIINALLSFLLWLLDLVLPELDFEDVVILRLTELATYITSGIKILAAYTDFEYLLVLLGLSILVSAFFNAYKLIRWIIRKIPFINIS